MKQVDHDTYELSTGRRFDGYLGMISLQTNLQPEGQFGSLTVVGGGCDGGIHEIHDWTQAERDELADFMIERWTAFKTVKFAQDVIAE